MQLCLRTPRQSTCRSACAAKTAPSSGSKPHRSGRSTSLTLLQVSMSTASSRLRAPALDSASSCYKHLRTGVLGWLRALGKTYASCAHAFLACLVHSGNQKQAACRARQGRSAGPVGGFEHFGQAASLPGSSSNPTYSAVHPPEQAASWHPPGQLGTPQACQGQGSARGLGHCKDGATVEGRAAAGDRWLCSWGTGTTRSLPIQMPCPAASGDGLWGFGV